MSERNNIIVAFDLYGTLLSTESIGKKLGERFGQDKAAMLAATWRKYQLEYTWRLNSMNVYEPFSEVTKRALQNTLAENDLSLNEAEIDDFMKAYDSLNTFPDVAPALKELAALDNVTAVVFSNGTKTMVTNNVHGSPDLGPHASLFKDLIVVEPVKCFKPDPRVYHMLAERMDKKDKMAEMWLVSGNPFDVVGARHQGMQAAWVDRAGKGWVDGLVSGDKGRPTVVCESLSDVVAAVKKQAAGQ